MTKVLFPEMVKLQILIFNIQSQYLKVRQGFFVNDNKHAPKSTIEIELMYKDIKNGASSIEI